MNPEQYFLSLPGGTVKFYKNEAHRPFDKATKSSTLKHRALSRIQTITTFGPSDDLQLIDLIRMISTEASPP